MGTLRDNPVFLREVRWWLRLSWLKRKRSARMVTGIIVLVFAYYYVNSIGAVWQGDDKQFRPLWFGLQRFLLTLIVLLGPALAASSIAGEREQQTWDALLLTRIRGQEVILGKWLATLIPLITIILAALPLMLVAYATFGTSLEEMFTNIFFFPLTAAAYTMLGVVCSFCSRRAATARVVALVVSISLCFGTVIFDNHLGTLFQPDLQMSLPFGAPGVPAGSYYTNNGMMQNMNPEPGVSLPEAAWVSPFYALTALSHWGGQTRYGLSGYYSTFGGWHQEPDPSAIFFAYLFCTVCTAAAGWLFVTTRYGKDFGGERRLGNP